MSNHNTNKMPRAVLGGFLALAVLSGCDEGASTGITTRNKPTPEGQVMGDECGQLDKLESIGNGEFRITGFLGNASCATLYQNIADASGSRMRDLGKDDTISRICVQDGDLATDGRGILGLSAGGLNMNNGFADASQRAINTALTEGGGYCGDFG